MPNEPMVDRARVARANRRNRSGKKRSGITKLFLANPEVSLIILGTLGVILVAVIAFMLYSANVQLDNILRQYQELSARASNSKLDFEKKLYYLVAVEGPNGELTLTLNTGHDPDDFSGDIDAGSEDEDDEDYTPPGFNVTINGDWYQDMGTIQGGSVVDSEGDIKVFNGWPWGDSGNTTFVNMIEFENSMRKDLKSATGNTMKSRNEVASRDWMASNATVDGVTCLGMAQHPIFVDKNYYIDSWSRIAQGLGIPAKTTAHSALLLRDKSGSYFFLPVTFSDAKMHIFPGGAFQTFIAHDCEYYALANILDDYGPFTKISESVKKGPNGGGDGHGDGAYYSADLNDVLNLLTDNNGPNLFYKDGNGNTGECKVVIGYEVASTSVLSNLSSDYIILGLVTEGL